MTAPFETVEKVWIKNQYSVAYTFTLKASSGNCSNFFLSGRPGMKNFSHPRTGNNFFRLAKKNQSIYEFIKKESRNECFL